ncbi:MAG TPA: Ig-like domain-containing protein [Gemmatimonadaceae bacterium]|jgi:hypothetical protein
MRQSRRVVRSLGVVVLFATLVAGCRLLNISQPINDDGKDTSAAGNPPAAIQSPVFIVRAAHAAVMVGDTETVQAGLDLPPSPPYILPPSTQLTMVSSDTTVATVASLQSGSMGRITALKPGDVTIGVTYNSGSGPLYVGSIDISVTATSSRPARSTP